MSSLNKAMIIGRLGKDPETKTLASGDAVTNISVATSESWKDKQTGEKKEQTEWHNVSAFGKLAEIMGQYLHKGSLVYIEGNIRTRKYQAADGSDRYATDILARSMQMLSPKSESPQNAAQAPVAAFKDDTDIPF